LRVHAGGAGRSGGFHFLPRFLPRLTHHRLRDGLVGVGEPVEEVLPEFGELAGSKVVVVGETGFGC
jgi:hypothetical protein